MLMCRAHWLALPCGLRCSILITFRHRLVRDYQALVSKAVDLIEGFERDPSVTRVSIDGVWTYYRGEVLS